MAFQYAVIENEVSKEVIFIYQYAFWRASKQKPCPISRRNFCKLSRMACSKSFSVTNARSFNPKNSKVKGVFITSAGCSCVVCCCTNAESASLFLDSPLRS